MTAARLRPTTLTLKRVPLWWRRTATRLRIGCRGPPLRKQPRKVGETSDTGASSRSTRSIAVEIEI